MLVNTDLLEIPNVLSWNVNSCCSNGMTSLNVFLMNYNTCRPISLTQRYSFQDSKPRFTLKISALIRKCSKIVIVMH